MDRSDIVLAGTVPVPGTISNVICTYAYAYIIILTKVSLCRPYARQLCDDECENICKM